MKSLSSGLRSNLVFISADDIVAKKLMRCSGTLQKHGTRVSPNFMGDARPKLTGTKLRPIISRQVTTPPSQYNILAVFAFPQIKASNEKSSFLERRTHFGAKTKLIDVITHFETFQDIW